MQEKERFIISREDWSLHRKGYQDQQRHDDKVRDAITNNLPDLISEESIVMSDGREVIKIPIRSLDEYKIRYNDHKSKQVGQGDGDSEVGDVVARGTNEPAHGKKEPGKGEQAGDQPGHDYYEAEITLAEIETALFEELELPALEEKESSQLRLNAIEFNDVRKKGLMGNIDKKRTILSALKRNATKGAATIDPIRTDDLRFKAWNDVRKPESNAVVFALMDTSGSMGTFEKYTARSFFFWMTRFLESKYETVEVVYIAHHTRAKIVSKTDFFSKGESGGTICSSAYQKVLDLMKETYHPDRYNLYPVHFSDGDNLSSDNLKCRQLVHEIMEGANLFGYGEVNPYNRQSTLMRAYHELDHPKFKHYIVKEKTDVYHALKHFFKKQV